MTITFAYRPEMEYANFRASFSSPNHAEPSPRQKLFFSTFSELTRENAAAFSEQYLRDHHIDPTAILREIEQRWRAVEQEFFRRADAIFGHSLPQTELTIFLTVHDRCSYNYQRGYFFIHTNLDAVTKTIMHELLHWYYFAFFGESVVKRFGQHRSNDIKEALTVLLNEEFSDLMPGVTDPGYPQHRKLRETIVQTYRETHDIASTIESALQSPV